MQQVRPSSREAHEAIKPKKQTHYKEILSAMKRIGKPVISKIIATHCSLDYHAVARRLSEMEKQEMVKVTGRDASIKNRPLLWEVV